MSAPTVDARSLAAEAFADAVLWRRELHRRPELSFQDALVKGYAVMDANAFGLCKENKLPIVVFNINQPGATARVLAGERVGTIVK